jgi:hypothetical protein
MSWRDEEREANFFATPLSLFRLCMSDNNDGYWDRLQLMTWYYSLLSLIKNNLIVNKRNKNSR